MILQSVEETGRPADGGAPGAQVTCSRCGQSDLRSDTISTAFWRDEGLMVIRGIPALVCETCNEGHIADITALALDRMRGTGFRPDAADGRMTVPVFDFVPVADE